MGSPAFLSEVVITDSNKWIDFELDAGEQNASIATGTYDDMRAVAAAHQAAIQALGGAAASVTISIGSDGTTTINLGGTGKLLWKTGTHGSDNTDTHCGDLYGFSDAADDTGAASLDSDNQHQHGFYANMGVKIDTKDRADSPGPATEITMDGTCERFSWSRNSDKNRIREVELQFITPAKFFEAEAGTNESLEKWWRDDASKGTYFQYYSDSSDFDNNDEGKYALIVDNDPNLLDGINRESPGEEYYQKVVFRMRRQGS